MRTLSQAVLEGTYRPGPVRSVRIPKLHGGHRTLRLSNLCERVLAAALHHALEPLWEKMFLPWSMGFRPGRSVWRLLAELEAIILKEDRWVFAIDDIKNAFDNVVIEDVIADHKLYFNDNRLLSLIKVVLQGSGGPRKERGIEQGCPYSPTALNVRLHHAHDLGAEQGHYPSRFRYADNLVYLCRDVPEGNEVLARSQQLLELVGFTLKGEDGVQDLEARTVSPSTGL
jgi:RNA-directed DNA polymerase